MILYFKYGGVSYHLIKIFLKHTRVIFGTIKLDKRQEAKQEETLGRCTFVSVTVTINHAHNLSPWIPGSNREY